MNEKIKKVLNNSEENYIFPFLWIHDEPEATIREYMQAIRNSNIRAVCIESRPHPDFCGDRWWHDMDIILDEAQKLEMKVWILDDSHFPTGYANGAMAEQPDSLCRRSICCRIREAGMDVFCMSQEEVSYPDPFEKSQIEYYTMEQEPRHFDDDRLLALYAVRIDVQSKGGQETADRVDLVPLLENGALKWNVPEGRWKVYAIHISGNFGYHRSYINMMDRESCRVLIDAVYEPHYDHYKKYFGTVIEGFFSDEPELGNGHMYEINDSFGSPNDYPWSRELEVEMCRRLGKDYSQRLALLWETEADSDLTAKVRHTYMDAVTKLVRENFSRQIGDWCRERGVRYIGHLIEDDNHSIRTGSSLGHYFRGLAGQDMAGIDDIGGQVFPQGEDISYNNGVFQHRNGEFYHFVLGKLASSAAAIEPGKNGDSMCEIFGNYGWVEGVRLEKYLADHFLVRGINHFVPHAFSMKDFPDPDCPPHFYAHGHNPQYRHFGCLMAYMNRICELISGGRHSSPVAVLYHAEGGWTGKYDTDDRIARCLAEAQIEYDIIPQDVFIERNAYKCRIETHMLCVNTQEYRALIIPYMQYVTAGLVEAVCELGAKHVPVYFTGGYPEGICDLDGNAQAETLLVGLRTAAQLITAPELPAVLEQKGTRDVSMTPADKGIRSFYYIHGDGTEVYLFVNEGTETYKGKIAFQSEKMAGLGYEYDPWENVIRPLPVSENGLILELEPRKSRIFIFDSQATAEEISCVEQRNCMSKEKSEQLSFSGVWTRSICKSIHYPDFGEKKQVCIPDCLAQEEPDFSGFVRYENEFETDGTGIIWAEITDAHESVEIFVNGVSMGIQIVPVYRFDLTPAVKPGKNRIQIEVATTLEREMAKFPDTYGNTKEAEALSGVTGEVRIWQRSFENVTSLRCS